MLFETMFIELSITLTSLLNRRDSRHICIALIAWGTVNDVFYSFVARAQLFERRLALTQNYILTRASFSFHQKDSLG